MQIQFHGAVRTVTGSQHLITVNNHKILLDCGLYQGKRQEEYTRNLHLPFDASSIDLLVLSHAHIDHCGNIPNLVKSGFKGDIICTHATRDLCSIMLLDSAKIQESDIKYVNKKRARKGEPPITPIYSMDDAMASLDYFVGSSYQRSRTIAPGVSLTFLDAGHILGSAIVVLDIEDQEAKQDWRVVFSGDVGRPNRPILRDPTPVDDVDILLVETTYGNREHKTDADSDAELLDVINQTVKRGGKVIVPAFAVGRTQELVYRIHRLVQDGKLSAELPIFVDSPMAIDATNVYRTHPEAFDREVYEFMEANQTNDPYGFGRMSYTRDVEQSKALNSLEGPAVIISASGMAESGRILHHIKNNAEDPRNTFLMVGWTAPDTLGRRIAEKSAEIKVFGEPYQLRAQVATINGYSAHADRSELLDWVGAIKKPPRYAFMVHGEEAASTDFAQALRDQNLAQNVFVPELHQIFQL